jgi:hypothetical protein
VELAPPSQAKATPLASAARLGQASQTVLGAAFQLHLLGLNARVMAARLGDQARGFATLSSEWVTLGKGLDAQSRALDQVSERLVRAISGRSMRRNRRTLLEACAPDARLAPWPPGERDLEGLQAVRKALRQLVAEAVRSCTFGLVIARSAKIEAAWSADARAALAALAVDFEAQLAIILPALRGVAALERRELS